MNRRRVLAALLCGGASVLPTRSPIAAARHVSRVSSEERTRMIAAVADLILPRTDTPGATDVGVVQWIDLMIAEYYSPVERRELLIGLSEIDALAYALDGRAFADLSRRDRERLITELDEQEEPRGAAACSYAQIKRLTIDGYFTSEIVQRHVLKVQIVPGRFDGCSPLLEAGA